MNKKFLKKLHKLPFFSLLVSKLKESEIAYRFVNGAFWSLAGTLVSRGLMLGASILVARILGQSQYGELGIVRSTVNMFTVFAGFGLGMTASKYIAEFREKEKSRTGKIIGLTTTFAGLSGGIIGLIILIAAPLIVGAFNGHHLIMEVRLGAFMMFLSALNGAQAGILGGFESFKEIAKINLFSGLISFPIQIGFAWVWGLTGSIIGFGLSFLFLWLFYFIEIRKQAKARDIEIQYRNSFSEWPILFKFSLPALLAGLLVTPVMWLCTTLLVRQPGGFEEMAIFDVANQWRLAILFIPGVLSKIILPLLSNSKDRNSYNKVIKISIFINLAVAVVMVGFISLAARNIMAFYGEGFSDGVYVLIILAVSTIFISVNNVVGQIIASRGKMWDGFFLNLVWAITLLILSFYFIRSGYGAYGLALSFLFSYISHTILQGVYIFRTKKSKIYT